VEFGRIVSSKFLVVMNRSIARVEAFEAATQLSGGK
jgi:hypothetical protein